MTLSETEKCELVTNCDRFATLKQSQFDSLSYQLLPENHLRGVTKMVEIYGITTTRPLADLLPTQAIAVIKKLKRRVRAEEKKLEKQSG